MPVDCSAREDVVRLGAAGDLLKELRGTRGLRPRVDRGLAGGLRAWLDDGLSSMHLADDEPVRVSPRTFVSEPSTSSASARLRGALVGQLVGLRAAGLRVAAPAAAALESLRARGERDPLLEVFASLDADDRARLAAEVDAHDEVLRVALPELPSRWSPRCGVGFAVPLHGGRVVCRGTVDLLVGQPGGTHASVCLVDVTTSHLGVQHEMLCRYLALLETIRSGEPPLRAAVLSTADAETIVRDVTPELLAHAVRDLLDVVPRALAA